MCNSIPPPLSQTPTMQREETTTKKYSPLEEEPPPWPVWQAAETFHTTHFEKRNWPFGAGVLERRERRSACKPDGAGRRRPGSPNMDKAGDSPPPPQEHECRSCRWCQITPTSLLHCRDRPRQSEQKERAPKTPPTVTSAPTAPKPVGRKIPRLHA